MSLPARACADRGYRWHRSRRRTRPREGERGNGQCGAGEERRAQCRGGGERRACRRDAEWDALSDLDQNYPDEKRRRPRRAAATVERELDELDREDAEDDVALRPRVLLVESMTTCSSSSSGGDCQRMACRAEGAQLRCSAHKSSGLPTHRMFELCLRVFGMPRASKLQAIVPHCLLWKSTSLHDAGGPGAGERTSQVSLDR